jgi:hypothetical protein
MGDQGMYDLVCKGRLDKIEQMQKETISLLRGKDGDPGLLDDVRNIKASHKRVVAGVALVVGAVVIQLLTLLVQWVVATAK